MKNPPDWYTPAYPEFRDGPPWVMEDMIASQPDLARSMPAMISSAAEAAEALRAAVGAHEPIVVIGCGTAEHAARGVAAQLEEFFGRGGTEVVARESFEAALLPQPGGVCVAVSDTGRTRATNAGLEAARANGARTVVITPAEGSPAATAADHVLLTPLADRSYCHTVGYLAPILAGAALVAALDGATVDDDALGSLLSAALHRREQAEAAAERLSGCTRIVCAGSGADAVAALELALKLEEGVQLPSAMWTLENLTHGHLIPSDPSTGLVLVVTDGRERARRAERAGQVFSSARKLGMQTAAIVTPDADGALASELTTAGRIVVADEDRLPPVLSSLAASAVALQLLAVSIANAVGANPDIIGQEEEKQREAFVAGRAKIPKAIA